VRVLFQICRVERIKCINAINLTIFQMRRYLPTGDYTDHYRKVEPSFSPDSRRGAVALGARRLHEAPARRARRQHDVLTAYAPDKTFSRGRSSNVMYALPPGAAGES
jgi:hypothetical protein